MRGAPAGVDEPARADSHRAAVSVEAPAGLHVGERRPKGRGQPLNAGVLVLVSERQDLEKASGHDGAHRCGAGDVEVGDDRDGAFDVGGVRAVVGEAADVPATDVGEQQCRERFAVVGDVLSDEVGSGP